MSQDSKGLSSYKINHHFFLRWWLPPTCSSFSYSKMFRSFRRIWGWQLRFYIFGPYSMYIYKYIPMQKRNPCICHVHFSGFPSPPTRRAPTRVIRRVSYNPYKKGRTVTHGSLGWGSGGPPACMHDSMIQIKPWKAQTWAKLLHLRRFLLIRVWNSN